MPSAVPAASGALAVPVAELNCPLASFVAVAVGSIATAYAVYRLRGGGIITPTTTVTSPPENRVPVRGPRIGFTKEK